MSIENKIFEHLESLSTNSASTEISLSILYKISTLLSKSSISKVEFNRLLKLHIQNFSISERINFHFSIDELVKNKDLLSFILKDDSLTYLFKEEIQSSNSNFHAPLKIPYSNLKFIYEHNKIFFDETFLFSLKNKIGQDPDVEHTTWFLSQNKELLHYFLLNCFHSPVASIKYWINQPMVNNLIQSELFETLNIPIVTTHFLESSIRNGNLENIDFLLSNSNAQTKNNLAFTSFFNNKLGELLILNDQKTLEQTKDTMNQIISICPIDLLQSESPISSMFSFIQKNQIHPHFKDNFSTILKAFLSHEKIIEKSIFDINKRFLEKKILDKNIWPEFIEEIQKFINIISIKQEMKLDKPILLTKSKI